MSIFSENTDMQVQAEVKAISKVVGKSIKQSGYEVPHSVLLHAISAALQQRNWHQLKAAINGTSAASSALALTQSGERAETENTSEALPRIEDLVGPVVGAKFYTDDRVFEVSFDARTYMATATDEQLSAIYSVGFHGDYCTDAVAENLASKWGHTFEGTSVLEAFGYLDARNQVRGVDALGFECRIDGESFLNWLDACRPQLAARILCDDLGVSIEQSQDKEDLGMWTWTYEGEGCEVSLASKEEAELDAYRVCSLLKEGIANKGMC